MKHKFRLSLASVRSTYLFGDAQLSNEFFPALFSFEHDVLDGSSADEPLEQEHRQVLPFVLRRVGHSVGDGQDGSGLSAHHCNHV